MKTRLDQELVHRQLAATRSQAESIIKLGQVRVNGQDTTKPAFQTSETDRIELTSSEQYVSRAGLKLASVADKFKLDFRDKIILDVGSSTGGFTDYALQHGASKVIAVDVGTNQLHPSLRTNPKVEPHEQTDIRDFVKGPSFHTDIIVIDVSFISLRHILPAVRQLCNDKTQVVAMAKPQFETHQKEDKNPSTVRPAHGKTGSGFRSSTSLLNRGVIKNDKIRRDILKDFEDWVQKLFKLINKADSAVAGAKGNQERFYLLVTSN